MLRPDAYCCNRPVWHQKIDGEPHPRVYDRPVSREEANAFPQRYQHLCDEAGERNPKGTTQGGRFESNRRKF